MGNGDCSCVITNGISVQPRTTASQPSSFSARITSVRYACVRGRNTPLYQFVENDAMDALALLRAGNAMLNAGGFQHLAVDWAFHQRAGSQNSQTFVAVTLRFVRDLDRNVQPGPRRPVLHQIESLMHGVDRSDQKIRASFGQLIRGREHQFGHAHPVVGIDALHVVGEVVAMHRNLRMMVQAEQLRAFQADGAIAQRSAFRAAGDDADVKGHSGQWPVISGQELLN